MSSKITLPDVEKESWGASFAQECRLTVAANVFTSMSTGETLYNTDLEERLADRLMPLDGGLIEEFHGIIGIPQGDGNWTNRVDGATAFLKDRPRGAWAIFRMDGGFDAYMSDGMGGLSTASGNKFQDRHPNRLGYHRSYADLLSGIAYYGRDEAEKAIIAETVARHGIRIGTEASDVYLDRKRWSRAVFRGPASESPYADRARTADSMWITAHRRGVKATDFLIDARGFVSNFGPPLQLPERLATALDEPHRLSSLRERRIAAAASVAFADAGEGVKTDNAAAYWRENGCVLSRSIWLASDQPGHPSRSVEVSFPPGGDQPLSVRHFNEGLPSLAAAPGPRR